MKINPISRFKEQLQRRNKNTEEILLGDPQQL